MGKRLRLEEKRDQEQSGRPPAGTKVKIAVDLSRSKWVYCVRWQGAERLRLSTGGELKHLQALVRRYEGCPVHLAFEACGFGYEVAWWAQHEQIAVTVRAGLHPVVGRRVVLQRSLSPGTGLLREPRMIIW
jgi:hypothetical protein